jgi:hypothetical protein
MQPVDRHSVLYVFAIHVLRVCDDGVILRKERQALALDLEEMDHRSGVETAASPWIVVQQATPAETPRARRCYRSLKRLGTTNTCAVIVVDKEHAGRKLEGPRLQLNIVNTMAKNQIGFPVAESIQCSVGADAGS